MRRSSFPPKLQKFVKSVEKNAQAAGHAPARARIFGAWAACFVRFCTVQDRDWRKPDHVPVFLKYLRNRKEVDGSSRERVAESMAFLFEELLKADVSDASWHPNRQQTAESEKGSTEKEGADQAEQSTLLTRLLFHTSLPINEALELCAGDVDIEAGLIYVSDPMGTPKQIVELPETLHDPLRRHLQRLREEHGPRFFDAPLFQARALQGRVNEEETTERSGGDQDSERVSTEVPADSESSDRPASLWGYASDS